MSYSACCSKSSSNESLPDLIERNSSIDDQSSSSDDSIPDLIERDHDDDLSSSSDEWHPAGHKLKCPVCNAYHDEVIISHHKKKCQKKHRCSHGATMILIPVSCPICMEGIVKPPNVALRCGHVLCTHDFQNIGGRIGEDEQVRPLPYLWLNQPHYHRQQRQMDIENDDNSTIGSEERRAIPDRLQRRGGESPMRILSTIFPSFIASRYDAEVSLSDESIPALMDRWEITSQDLEDDSSTSSSENSYINLVE